MSFLKHNCVVFPCPKSTQGFYNLLIRSTFYPFLHWLWSTFQGLSSLPPHFLLRASFLSENVALYDLPPVQHVIMLPFPGMHFTVIQLTSILQSPVKMSLPPSLIFDCCVMLPPFPWRIAPHFCCCICHTLLVLALCACMLPEGRGYVFLWCVLTAAWRVYYTEQFNKFLQNESLHSFWMTLIT